MYASIKYICLLCKKSILDLGLSRMPPPRVVNTILNLPFPVSDEQKEAILSNAKYVRVIAGAGAGKTETITRRIAYLMSRADRRISCHS